MKGKMILTMLILLVLSGCISTKAKEIRTNLSNETKQGVESVLDQNQLQALELANKLAETQLYISNDKRAKALEVATTTPAVINAVDEYWKTRIGHMVVHQGEIDKAISHRKMGQQQLEGIKIVNEMSETESRIQQELGKNVLTAGLNVAGTLMSTAPTTPTGSTAPTTNPTPTTPTQ